MANVLAASDACTFGLLKWMTWPSSLIMFTCARARHWCSRSTDSLKHNWVLEHGRFSPVELFSRHGLYRRKKLYHHNRRAIGFATFSFRRQCQSRQSRPISQRATKIECQQLHIPLQCPEYCWLKVFSRNSATFCHLLWRFCARLSSFFSRNPEGKGESETSKWTSKNKWTHGMGCSIVSSSVTLKKVHPENSRPVTSGEVMGLWAHGNWLSAIGLQDDRTGSVLQTRLWNLATTPFTGMSAFSFTTYAPSHLSGLALAAVSIFLHSSWPVCWKEDAHLVTSRVSRSRSRFKLLFNCWQCGHKKSSTGHCSIICMCR